MRLPRPAHARSGAGHFDVVGLGEISVDDVLLVEGTPSWGGKARVARRERIGGGQVATAMVALTRLGLRAAIVGAVGDDEAGRFALAGLAKEGVDVSGVRVVAGRTRRATVIVDATANRTVLAEEDDGIVIDPAALREEQLTAGRVLHLDGRHPRAAITAARVARAAGVLVSCDLDHPGHSSAAAHGDDAPPASAIVALTDVCTLSISYFAGAAPHGDNERGRDSASDQPGDRLPDRAWLANAVRALANAAATPRLACVTLGEDGALGSDGGEPLHQPAFAVTPLVDTTACGDTFRAGLLAALLDGRDLPACLRFANAAAALKVRDLGRRGCPTRAEVEALLHDAPSARHDRT